MTKTITVEDYRDMEMMMASEENSWGDSDRNDMELLFDEETTAYDNDLF